MKHSTKGRAFARKVVALLLVLVMVVALPIVVHAADEMPDGAVRVLPWSYEATGIDGHWFANVGFDILDITSQRVIYDMEEVRGWPRYERLISGGDRWLVDSIVVYYVDAPAIVLPVNFIELSWTFHLPYFGDEVDAQIKEAIVRTYVACEECSGCEEGLDCDWPSITTTGYFTFSEPGMYPFTQHGTPLFLLVVKGESATDETEQSQPDVPTTAPNLSTASDWARDSIDTAYAHGLVPQGLQSQYTQAITRAEFAALAVALYEASTGNEITARAQFNDTTDINVQKMAGLGVVNGEGDGNFVPDRTITRQEAAVLLARLSYVIGQPLPAYAPTFADNASIATWAVDGVGQVQAAGIINGIGNNAFDPTGAYTREQSIVTMLRLFSLLMDL